MLGAAIIVFREIIEAALIVSIVLAATKGVVNRGRWVSGGLSAGVIGAFIVAIFASAIADAMEGIGQEIFNAGVLMAAVLMLAWHNIWMASHGKELAQQMNQVGKNVSAGSKPLHALSIVVGLAVLREGSEIVLFLNGIAMSGKESWLSIFGGSFLGLSAGLLLGVLMYFGLLRIPMKHFFNVTGWMILFLSAGMAASAASFLEQAGLVPILKETMWDTSFLLQEKSAVGQLLHVLIGYYEKPSGIQVLFYTVVLVSILLLTRLVGFVQQKAQPVQ